jgi:hypothetical protein
VEKQPSEIAVSVKDEMFELKLYVDKDIYKEDEIINCYSTLEYIGKEEDITVYSSDPLVGFSLKDDKYFDGGYAVNDELITTTFKKGETVRYDYMKSGGWTADDPNADFYQEFFSERNLILPSGLYEISATINCSLDIDDILGSKYTNSVVANIKVTE